MVEEKFFIEAVGDAHDVDVVEFGPAFAPVGVGHNIMASDLAPGLGFATRGDSPME